MATNLVNRIPIPGSFGVSPGTDVSLRIQTSGTVAQSTVSIQINGTPALLNGAFRPGFGGTINTDGSGGWNIVINPTTNFSYGSTQSVSVQCVEQPGSISFSQTYSFQTKRNIEVTPSVCYYEDGDVLEADFWIHEGQIARPSLVNALAFAVKREGQTVDTIFVDNVGRDMATEGSFKLRLLHPPQINKQMTFEAQAFIDPYQAPGISSIVVADTIAWEPRRIESAVAQTSTQPDVRINAVVPQSDPSEYSTSAAQTITQAQYEVVDVADSGDAVSEPSLLVDLDFLNTSQYLQTMDGDPTYAGGGSRLLVGIDNTDEFVLQEIDELPVVFGARMLIEGSASNLLPNSLLTTNPFSLVVPDGSIRADVELQPLASGVNQAMYAVEGSIIYDGNERNIKIQTPSVGIVSGQPVLCSVLARVQLRDDKVTLDTFTLRVRFYNGMDIEVGSSDFDYDIFAFESSTTFSLMEGYVPASSVPATATKASFDLVIGSWEGCDLMNLWLAAPVIEQAAFTTSRVVGDAPSTRAADSLTLPQYGNLNQRAGRVIITYAPQYDGSPPVDVCLWDTRSNSQISGYVLRQLTNGRMQLTCTNDVGASTVALSAQPVVLSAGVPVEVVGQWRDGALTVQVNKIVVAEFSGNYSKPTTIQPTISIGRQVDGSEPLYGEVHAFRIYGIY